MKYLIMQERNKIMLFLHNFASYLGNKRKKIEFYHDRGTNQSCINWINTVSIRKINLISLLYDGLNKV